MLKVIKCLGGKINNRPAFEFPLANGIRLRTKYDQFNKRVRFSGFAITNHISKLTNRNSVEEYADTGAWKGDYHDYSDSEGAASNNDLIPDEYVQVWLDDFLI